MIQKISKKLKRLKVVGLIPVRGNSIGVKNKNLKKVEGYSLLARSIMALKVAGVETVYVSSEDHKLKMEGLVYGAQIINQPECLAASNISLELVIENFLKEIRCDVVVMLQVTSPMLKPMNIQQGLATLLREGLDCVFSAVKTNDMLLWKRPLKPINYNPRERGTRQTRKNFIYIETGAFYIFKTVMFEKIKCRIGGKIGVSEIPFWESFQVDTPKDLSFIRKLLKK